jgi:hypothetical protein
MDGRQFDSIARTLAGRTSRRKLLWRGAAAGGVLGSLTAFEPASAARRGGGGSTTLVCTPDGAGGYYRNSVPTLLLQTHLNSGSIISACCAHAECGESNGCVNAFCDFGGGSCVVDYFDGSPCARSGCADGFCFGGVCNDPPGRSCAGDGFCNSCFYNTCGDYCECTVRACYTDDYQCMDAYCDPGLAACVTAPINEGSPCNTTGVNGTCQLGYCTAV